MVDKALIKIQINKVFFNRNKYKNENNRADEDREYIER